MSAYPEPVVPVLTPARTRGPVLAALAAALLGLTLLDAPPLPHNPPDAAAEPDSADCIVASAVFAGVGSTPPMR